MNPSSIVEESKGLEHLKYGICEECSGINTEVYWCRACNSKRFQQNFNNWSSGNDDIDKFIQNIQISSNKYKILEWIPYNRFYEVEHLSSTEYLAMEGYFLQICGFGTMSAIYRARWKDGFINNWDQSNDRWKIIRRKRIRWKRICQNELVILKILNNSQDIINTVGNKLKLLF